MSFNPKYTITPQITQFLLEIERHKEGFAHLPITAPLIASLRESARLMTTHYSTQIEGNRLTMEEVSQVVIDGKSGFPGRDRDEKEVKNYFLALEFVENTALEQVTVSEELIKTFHGLSFHGKPKPTPYRDGQNVIRDSGSGAIIYMPPEAVDVPLLMKDLKDWIGLQIEGNTLPIPLIAAIAHYQFATVHPYYDGNGRTARLLTTFILHACGYGLDGIFSLEEYYAKNLDKYYQTLTVGPSHNYYGGRAESDITEFLHYFCHGMAEAFANVHQRAKMSGDTHEMDYSQMLRTLSPQQKGVISLFAKQMEVRSSDVAEHLGIGKRSASELANKWVKEGFLIVSNPSKKGRTYRLSQNWEKYVRIEN